MIELRSVKVGQAMVMRQELVVQGRVPPQSTVMSPLFVSSEQGTPEQVTGVEEQLAADTVTDVALLSTGIRAGGTQAINSLPLEILMALRSTGVGQASVTLQPFILRGNAAPQGRQKSLPLALQLMGVGWALGSAGLLMLLQPPRTPTTTKATVNNKPMTPLFMPLEFI